MFWKMRKKNRYIYIFVFSSGWKKGKKKEGKKNEKKIGAGTDLGYCPIVL